MRDRSTFGGLTIPPAVNIKVLPSESMNIRSRSKGKEEEERKEGVAAEEDREKGSGR